MTLSIETRCVFGDLNTKLKAICEAGFQSIELCENDLISYQGTSNELRKFLTTLGLHLSAFQKFSNLEGFEGKERISAFDRLERKIDLMEDIGGDLLILSSSHHPRTLKNPEKIKKDLQQAGEIAKKRKIRIAYLALPWGKTIQSDLEAYSFIEEVNHSNLGLALNSWFSLGDGSKATKLRYISTEKIFHVQLADAPLLNGVSYSHQSQPFLLPGQGDLNLSGFTSILARNGYRGSWSLASLSKNPTFWGHTAQDCYRALVTLLDEVKKSESGVDFPIPTLPQKAVTSGFEFIEFATDLNDEKILASLLSSMGFRQERRHRSQDVVLWRQGAVNLMVNQSTTGPAHDLFLQHGTCVSDLALRVQDAENTMARAQRLGSQVFNEIVGVGEVSLPTIRGVGDHLVHFIDEKSNLHRMWEINFQKLPQNNLAPPTGIRRVDHVAETMEYDQMQNWLLYYLTTFLMKKSSILDVADPSGIIRSQVLATPEGEVRLNLNSSQSKSTLAGSFLSEKFGSGVQHIAFLTDDIFETSNRLEELGFKRLPLSANYYADLKTTFSLDPKMVEQLQTGNIFYDCDGQGEYFQIYSLPVFQGFFFEVVERRNGYEGYGARNAPFRIQAQMKYLQETNRDR